MKDIFITSSVLILSILLIRFLFRKAISRQAQYALWGLVLLRLLVPVNIGNGGWSVASVAERIPGREIAETVVTVRGGISYDLAPPMIEHYSALPTAERQTQYRQDLAEWNTTMQQSKIETGGTPVTVRDVLRYGWYAGMAVMSIWFLTANLRFARKLRRTRVSLDGAGSKYPVYLCDDIPSPCLFGLFRPAIYVTSEAAKNADRLRYVIAHEETHARHLDLLWSLLRSVCLVIWWFNPLVWAAAHCSKLDCELACDEDVLAQLGAAERAPYGETLLALIPVRRGGDPMLAATTMTAGKRRMKDRITRIAQNRKPLLWALGMVGVLTIIVCAVTFTGAADRSSDPAPSPASVETPKPSATSKPEPTVETSEPIISTFDGILGLSGYYVEQKGADGITTREYFGYLPDGSVTQIGFRYGEGDDYIQDLDGDGYIDLICNDQHDAVTYIYKRDGNSILMGHPDLSKTDYADWNGTASFLFDPVKSDFVLHLTDDQGEQREVPSSLSDYVFNDYASLAYEPSLHRYNGNGWHMDVPDLWDENLHGMSWVDPTGVSSITVMHAVFDTRNMKAYYARESWPYETDMPAPFDLYYDNGHHDYSWGTKTEVYFVPESDASSFVIQCDGYWGERYQPDWDMLHTILQTFTVDENAHPVDTDRYVPGASEMAVVLDALADPNTSVYLGLTRDGYGFDYTDPAGNRAPQSAGYAARLSEFKYTGFTAIGIDPSPQEHIGVSDVSVVLSDIGCTLTFYEDSRLIALYYQGEGYYATATHPSQPGLTPYQAGYDWFISLAGHPTRSYPGALDRAKEALEEVDQSSAYSIYVYMGKVGDGRSLVSHSGVDLGLIRSRAGHLTEDNERYSSRGRSVYYTTENGTLALTLTDVPSLIRIYGDRRAYGFSALTESTELEVLLTAWNESGAMDTADLDGDGTYEHLVWPWNNNLSKLVIYGLVDGKVDRLDVNEALGCDASTWMGNVANAPDHYRNAINGVWRAEDRHEYYRYVHGKLLPISH